MRFVQIIQVGRGTEDARYKEKDGLMRQRAIAEALTSSRDFNSTRHSFSTALIYSNLVLCPPQDKYATLFIETSCVSRVVCGT